MKKNLIDIKDNEAISSRKLFIFIISLMNIFENQKIK